ncbi:MAG: hypothetical protein VKL60_20225 [Sphaerospermopsis sp.]|uniref:Transposase n=1 Tax=Sphaerospermopsis kisseleviana CS-549 TaxID=3021783 RepID=A0ABT4ZMA9_9CYAN|nr:hypothetical protein [Sphaerospermopsis kisseleviana]MDB9440522.1 hypothetical protein [Sphaerospermopsis kisseleviana CS-549]MEB3151333.1 hypothetical protein [Sphaerospermopsis sp.]BAZ80055.1 hypothetical protein NIES73_13030 [Sphaerospermopsis kisseleviana NIES-73]
MTNAPENKSAKKAKQSFIHVDIGVPKVPVRKNNTKKQQRELLSDWEHAS